MICQETRESLYTLSKKIVHYVHARLLPGSHQAPSGAQTKEDKMSAKKHWIVIRTGNGDYGPKVGWDTEYSTRAEAEDAAKRAEKMDGWSARVVSA